MMHGNDPLYGNGGEIRHEPDIPTGLLRVAGVFALSLLLVSNLPAALVPAALAQLLFVAALALSTIAVISNETISAPTLTRWDETALLLALALVSSMMIDPEAATSAMETLASPMSFSDGRI